MRYRFIDGQKRHYPAGLLCRVMDVSRSAYHAYRSGKSYALSAPEAGLGAQVKGVFFAHRRRDGSRRIRAELQARGTSVGRFAVRSQMKRLKSRAIAPKRFAPRTTDSRQTVEPSPNLLLDARTRHLSRAKF